MAEQGEERNKNMDKVLIIDDDKELCALMKRCIEQEGVLATVAYGDAAGLRLLDVNKEAVRW